mgnify:CR=1 FL=1
MGYVKWSYDTLNTFCHDVFRKFGFNEEETNIIKDVLLTADLYGIESHGMQRMVRYDKGIEKGTIHPDAKPEVVFETPVSAVIDGHDGMGQLISHFAMEKAIEKAKKTGVGFVSVRNSNHFGIAGYYAEMASKQGLLGMACTNSEAIMVPTFGRKAMLGSNPIAVAMPAEPYPFLFDCSTTVVTRGKLEMYNKMGKPLPQGWALGANGQESTDAPDVLANIVAKKGGGIMPLGGNKEVNGSHKGYGYGMLCEIFSSIFSMGVTSDKCCTFKDKTGICHGFAAIDPAIFGNADDIRAHFSEYLCVGLLSYSLVLMWWKGKVWSGRLLIGVQLLLSASLDEIHQYFVPGRYAAVKDVFIDCAGGITGMVIIGMAFTLRRHKKSPVPL